MRFGAKGLMSTLMRVRISSDAPRCTVQFGAPDPRCTMVQVHGDPNEPSLGAGAAVAPCVTLAAVRTAVLAAAALTAVHAAQPTARVDARASASVAVPAASQLKTSYSYFGIATSLQGCSDEIALTFMGSVTSYSFVISTFQGTL